jgi:hypothetical protein
MTFGDASRILGIAALASLLSLGTAYAQSAQALGTIEQFFGMGTSLLSQGESLEQQREMMRQQNAIQQQQQAGQAPTCPTGYRHVVIVHAYGQREIVCEEITP